MCLITVGICVRNSEGTIAATINSIVSQNFPRDKMEIIIVDGNSQDKTLDVVNNLVAATEIKCRIFSDKGEGLGAARQIVVEKALGEHILWVDADVQLGRDFIRNQLSFMEKNPNVGIARGKTENVEAPDNVLIAVQNLFFSVKEEVYMGATICRTEAIRETGGFDKRIKGAAEDDDLRIRMAQRLWNNVINNEAKFTHSQRGNLRSFLTEHSWYGYGGHFIRHKHKGLISIVYRFPPIFFGWGLKMSRKSYRQDYRKKSFLIPMLCLLIILSWWFGFTKGHIDGYGH